MNQSSATPLSGQELIADYQSVYITLATIEAAKHEAERSEHDLVDHLASMSRGTFLNPTVLTNDPDIDITKASVDAHIKKVQAQQFQTLSTQQLAQLTAHATSTYVGKKVHVTVIDPSTKPVDALWWDQRNGYRNNQLNKSSLNGVIEDVLLEKNMLVLKPSRTARLINSNLQNYVVYVINPTTLTPMVDITFL